MQTTWTVIIVSAYGALLTWVALRARAARQFSDFSLAGRSLPLPLVFGSLAATYVGPAFSMGFVGFGFRSGYLYLGIGLALAVQNILVGWLLAPRLRDLEGCHTLGDVMGQKYNRSCQVLAGLISVGFCAGFAGVMIKAGGQLVANATALPLWSAVIIVGGITTLYTTFGGLRASVVTDAFQFLVFTILLPVVLLLLFFHAGRAGAFAEKAKELTMVGWAEMSVLKLIGLIAAFLLGETLLPPYANRALASKSTQVSRYGFMFAGCFSMLWFVVMVALGIVAAMRPTLVNAISALPLPAKAQNEAVLMALVENSLPRVFYTLLLVVLISIIMSSLDSLLNAGAVAFTEDVVKPLKSLSDNQALMFGRCATILIAAGAAAAALSLPGIIDGLLICYNTWAPAILPALILGLWLKRPLPAAGMLSMITGTTVAIIFQFLSPYTEVPGIPISLGAALLAYGLGWMVGKRGRSCIS